MDTWLFEAIQSWTGQLLLDQAMSLIAVYLILVVPVTLVILWLTDHRKAAFTVFIVTVAAIFIAHALGLLYYHDPPHLQGYETILENNPENAFPSNHAAAIFGFAAGFAYLRRRRLFAGALLVAVAIGFARVYTGLHFPIDIAGGALAAGLAVLLVHPLRPLIDRLFTLVRTVEHRLWGLVQSALDGQ